MVGIRWRLKSDVLSDSAAEMIHNDYFHPSYLVSWQLTDGNCSFTSVCH
jgi:hypothetical protein